MRIIYLILLLTLSTFCQAKQTSTWVERDDYTFIPEHIPALKAAKDYVRANKKADTQLIWHYEYKITSEESGFYVFIVEYTVSEEGKKLYYPGAHFSLKLDKDGNITEMIPGL